MLINLKIIISFLVKYFYLGPFVRFIYDYINRDLREIRKSNLNLMKMHEVRLKKIRKFFYKEIKSTKKTALIVANSRFNYILHQAPVIASILKSGMNPIVILGSKSNSIEMKMYKAIGINSFAFWDEIDKKQNFGSVINKFEKIDKQEDILLLKWKGVRVGKQTISILMRKNRKTQFNLKNIKIKNLFRQSLLTSLSYTLASHYLIKKWKPNLVLLSETGYPPGGILFEVCIEKKIKVITYSTAHANNSLILKSYTKQNYLNHPFSISQKNWEKIKKSNFSKDKWLSLKTEIDDSYKYGKWFQEVGTQYNTKIFCKNNLIKTLNLDKSKKTVLFFPHIFWDATFFWGKDIFKDYEDWFRQTLKEAIANDKVNWIIKIHPATIAKNIRDNVHSYSELEVLNEFHPLPNHIIVLPVDTNISTRSLFSVGDICLTVRGTVGIEAAIFGLSVLTAGTGRYDDLGFTIDSNNQVMYKKYLRNLQILPKPSNKKILLARKYAYATFISLPIQITSFPFEFSQERDSVLKGYISKEFIEKNMETEDIIKISNWIKSKEVDFFGGGKFY